MQNYIIPCHNTDLVVKTENGATIINCNDGISVAAELNDTGFTIWQLINGERSVSGILKLLSSSLENISSPRAQENLLGEVKRFLKELEKQGFIRMRRLQQSGQITHE